MEPVDTLTRRTTVKLAAVIIIIKGVGYKIYRNSTSFDWLVWVSCLTLPFLGGARLSADVSTLNDAIVRSLAIDPVIRKVESDVHEASGYEREVKADLLPQIRLEGSSGYANRDRSIDGVSSGGQDLFSRQIALVGEQLLWDSGFQWYRWKDAERRKEGQEMLEKAKREMTALYAIEAYLDVIRAREQIALAKRNLQVHQEIRALARDRADAAGNQADIELSSARYNLALTLLRERELALDQASVLFHRYVGMRPPGNLASPRVPRISSVDSIDPAKNFHHQAAVLQRRAARLAVEAVERRYSPRLMFRGTGGVGEDVLGIKGEDNEVSALVVVQWDVFEGWRKKGLMEQAIADVERQTAIIDETLVLLTQDIRSRWADYSTLSDRIGILRDYRSRLGETAKLYEEQFELGTRPLLSVLDIKNEEIGAAIRITDEEFERAVLSYRLLSFGGRLIAETVGEKYLDLPVEAMGVPIVHPSTLRAVPKDQVPTVEEEPVEKFKPFWFLQKKSKN